MSLNKQQGNIFKARQSIKETGTGAARCSQGILLYFNMKQKAFRSLQVTLSTVLARDSEREGKHISLNLELTGPLSAICECVHHGESIRLTDDL